MYCVVFPDDTDAAALALTMVQRLILHASWFPAGPPDEVPVSHSLTGLVTAVDCLWPLMYVSLVEHVLSLVSQVLSLISQVLSRVEHVLSLVSHVLSLVVHALGAFFLSEVHAIGLSGCRSTRMQ